MSIRDEMIDVLENEIEPDLEAVIALPDGSKEIPCSPSMEEVGSEVVINGQLERIDLVVRVRKSLFVDASNDEITVDTDMIYADNVTYRPTSGVKGWVYRTKQYRVIQVGEDASGAYYKVRFKSGK